ncbi:hypothetical protein INT47_008936, partial [Mucor saturninus]
FNNSELSKGFHLLTESSHTVKVNTPSVPPNSAHLYPRLAGSNWTSYLTQPSIILGRSGTAVRSTRQTPAQAQVDLDFGSSKAISRKHCEIRFSYSRDRWELYVHSRNGVKLNQIMKKPHDKPNVLKTGALIEICNTSFIFFLPSNYIKPTYQDKNQSSASTPENNTEDNSLDHELEIALIQIFEDTGSLNTTEILERVKHCYTKPVEKESILHLLVLSPRFQLAPSSISMSSKDADSVKWILIPLTTNLIGADGMYDKDEMSINAPTSNTKSAPILEKDKNHVVRLDSNDDMSIVSTPVAGHDSQPFSVMSHSNHDDMSIASPSGDVSDGQPISWKDIQPFKVRSYSDNDNMSISTSGNGVLPDEDSTKNVPSGISISLSRFFDKEDGWSLFMQSHDDTHTEANGPNQPISQTPTIFRAMSIESMYSVWSNGTSYAGDAVEHGERPNKRLKSVEKDGEGMNKDMGWGA